MPNLKIIFWGTPEFATLSLEALLAHGYKIEAVITNPDEPVGREQALTPPPVKVLAEKHKISVFQPENLKNSTAKSDFPREVRLLAPDVFIVAAYGKIVPKEILEIPKYGALNIHPSLLPRWRGPSPIQSAILNGDTETGVTIIKIDELMDHGPIVAQQRLEISKLETLNSKITYKELHDGLAKLGAELLTETIPKWVAGEITPIPQDDTKATYSKILKKEDGRINWSKPAEYIERMVRAFNPWPGTWTTWPHGGKIYRVRIEEADLSDEEIAEGSPGYVWEDDKFPLLVKTPKGSLAIRAIKIEGKKTLEAEEFKRGHPQITGTNLI